MSQLSNPSLSDRLVLVLGPLLLWFILGSVTRSLTQLAATKTTTLTLWSGPGLSMGDAYYVSLCCAINKPWATP